MFDDNHDSVMATKQQFLSRSVDSLASSSSNLLMIDLAFVRKIVGRFILILSCCNAPLSLCLWPDLFPLFLLLIKDGETAFILALYFSFQMSFWVGLVLFLRSRSVCLLILTVGWYNNTTDRCKIS